MFVLQVTRKTCEFSPGLQWAWIPLTASPEGTLGAEYSHEAEECSATAIGPVDETRTRNTRLDILEASAVARFTNPIRI